MQQEKLTPKKIEELKHHVYWFLLKDFIDRKE